MRDAHELVQKTLENPKDSRTLKLSEMADKAAEEGKFFIEIYKGKTESKDTSLIVIEQYGVEALNFMQRLHFIFASCEDVSTGDMVLYMGWGFTSAKELLTTVNHSA